MDAPAPTLDGPTDAVRNKNERIYPKQRVNAVDITFAFVVSKQQHDKLRQRVVVTLRRRFPLSYPECQCVDLMYADAGRSRYHFADVVVWTAARMLGA